MEGEVDRKPRSDKLWAWGKDNDGVRSEEKQTKMSDEPKFE